MKRHVEPMVVLACVCRPGCAFLHFSWKWRNAQAQVCLRGDDEVIWKGLNSSQTSQTQDRKNATGMSSKDEENDICGGNKKSRAHGIHLCAGVCAKECFSRKFEIFVCRGSLRFSSSAQHNTMRFPLIVTSYPEIACELRVHTGITLIIDQTWFCGRSHYP